MKNFKYIFFASTLLFFTNCNDPEDVDLDPIVEAEPLPELTAGSADFSTYVALGNSLTAGFTDGSLFIASQENSLPNILSQKFALVGGGVFTQPLTNDNFGGLAAGGNRIADPRLIFDGETPAGLESLIGPVTVTTDIILNNPTGPFNNMGVPGAKSFHLLAPGYGNLSGLFSDPVTANPFFVRMASSANASMLGDAMAQSPTFFSLWIGANDVLGYALSGGDGTNPITPVSGAPGVGFDGTYGALIATLTAGGAKGVVANIPGVTSVPHFTTIVWNQLDPNDADIGPVLVPQIPALNAQLYGPLDAIFTAFGEPDRMNLLSATEANPLLIIDENAEDRSLQITGALTPVLGAPTATAFGFIFGKARQATSADLVVLSASSAISAIVPGIPAPVNVRGISYPMEDKWVLLPSEQEEIAIATAAFNAIIAGAASQAGLALVDANALLDELANGGITSGNFTLESNLVTGSAFSLDGFHPTARGYAFISNEFMKAIDATYGSNFEASGNFVNVGDYPTNYSPLLQ